METTEKITRIAYAVVRNDSAIAIKSITLHHQFSDDPEESKQWFNLQAGQTTPTSLVISYRTGFLRTGTDGFWAEITLLDDSVWVSDGDITYTLHTSNEGKIIIFTINGSVLTAPNGSSMKLLHGTAVEYNSWAAISMSNNFPVEAQITLNHKYADYAWYKACWELLPGESTDNLNVFIVYFKTGFIRGATDHWNVSIILNIEPYDNAPKEAFKEFQNSDLNKNCMLNDSDNGKLHYFLVNGSAFTMGIESGSCTDDWRTWNGYNTLAFMKIQNAFTLPIIKVKLTHQYSSDTIWEQTRAVITPDEYSSLMVAEYNTGLFSVGSDHWNVTVYLNDGKQFKNKNKNKRCTLSDKDALQPLIFVISAEYLTIISNNFCNDAMQYSGFWDNSYGRDKKAPYNLNAFIGSHNAFANFAEGFWYAQQSSSILEQMACGATTLLLDIHYQNNDIYLIHESSAFQFTEAVKLSTVLMDIKDFLMCNNETITIIFEDRVPQEYQLLIKQAFIDSGTWSMVFNADTKNVSSNGWPTLEGLIQINQPLVVFTSKTSSNYFPYQWTYMSENVYGNESLDPVTWLNPRSESKPLNELALCALNHFPTVSMEAFVLTTFISRSYIDNDATLVKQMIDECHSKYSRYPNWINADFWEFPPNAMTNAIYYLNQKLRGLAVADSVLIEDNMIIIERIEYDNLLISDWKQETLWLDKHFNDLCQPIKEQELGRVDTDKLEDMVNLSIVIATLYNKNEAYAVNDWIQKIGSKIISYLFSIETELSKIIKDENGNRLLKYCIPFFLFEKLNNIQFEITKYIKKIIHHKQFSANDHDNLLLMACAGDTDSLNELKNRFHKSLNLSSFNSSQAYDLTHLILYGLLNGVEKEFYSKSLDVLEMLMGKFMPANVDLGAELLSCYWLCGGKPNAKINSAVRHLKTFSMNDGMECHKNTDSSKCTCLKLKDITHHKLTMLLGLSSTLICAGEVLSNNE